MTIRSTLLITAALTLVAFGANAQIRADDSGRKPSAPAVHVATPQGGEKSLNPNTGENELKNDLSNMRKKSEAAAAKHEADNASKGLQGNGMQIGKGSAASADNPLNKSAADEYKHIKDQQEAAKQKKQQEALGKAMPAMACKQECTQKYNSPAYGGNYGSGLSDLNKSVAYAKATPEEKAKMDAEKKAAEEKQKAAEAKAEAEKEQKIKACIKECIAKK